MKSVGHCFLINNEGKINYFSMQSCTQDLLTRIKTLLNINNKIDKLFIKEVKSKYLFNYHRIYKFHKYLIFGFLSLSIYYFVFYVVRLHFRSGGITGMDSFLLITQIILISFNFGIIIWFIKKKKEEIDPNIIVTRIEYYKIVCKELLNYI